MEGRLTKLGERSAIVLAASIVGLAWAGPVLAAKSKRESKQETKREVAYPVSESWEVVVDGHAHKVKPGGEVVYYSCNTVETIKPVVGIKVQLGPKPPEDYEWHALLVGPTAAGKSADLAGSFRGTSGTVDSPFTPNSFKKLSEIVGIRRFAPGTYELRLMIGTVNIELKVPEKITLTSNEGCG